MPLFAVIYKLYLRKAWNRAFQSKYKLLYLFMVSSYEMYNLLHIRNKYSGRDVLWEEIERAVVVIILSEAISEQS